MTIDQMREHINKMYPTGDWQVRVSRMADKQVVAIYLSTYHIRMDKLVQERQRARQPVQLCMFNTSSREEHGDQYE